MSRWFISLLGFLALAQQVVLGDASSLVLVLHRHGDFGIHGHLVSMLDADRGIGGSSEFGHGPWRTLTMISENANVIGMFAGCQMPGAPTVDANHDEISAPSFLVACTIGTEPVEFQRPFGLHADRRDIHIYDGDDPLSRLIKSSHALLV